MEISGKSPVRRITKYVRKFDDMLGSPWGEVARRFEARRAQIVRVRMALAEWKGDRQQTAGDPDDLTTEELVETERILRVAALAVAETERLSGLYESVVMRVSAVERKIEPPASTIEKPAGTANDRP
jgi:hypothetical protein